ncbi:extracellular solute-binding protein [Devosia psychrophila]|jgi:putative spermidine/putrescine transport system substrate-binding protein|uniref:ABC transporter substrate-binding protein n=1 Tax=Devosia psychrophila TaxID=728005 RepID=A0A0F5PUD0_9HYPH|nr:extracellular solute-binding protein [Devosia psychrophila]KKC32011.1 ABC transporter substrate-binding protein [Devosia psychrophila]SFC75737.1 putative spermidine/putrescine transport system substrate-binding protein [Devosia psychrophila]
MKRRDFILATGVAAGALMLPRMSFAAEGVIDVYFTSDQNVIDFWTNTVKPKFEAANAGITLNLVDGGDSAGVSAIADRALAALAGGSDPQADLFEGFDSRVTVDGIAKGLYVDFEKAGLSNYSKINPLAFDIPTNLPYRGSQVLLAYDTTKLDPANVPKTWADLVAWIKANPGQFIYNRPNKGGSGGNFVRRAIFEANGNDPTKFSVDNYTAEAGDAMLNPAWAILNDLAPSLFDGGAYTSGNTQSIQLLSQSAVTMIPAWSDQTLSAIAQGALPETTGLVQLQDLGLPGGFTKLAVLSNGANKDAALKLADFLLTEEIQSAVLTELGGYPGVSWDNISAELREKFADIIPTTIPTFPGGDWEKAVNDGWYRAVAPNVDPAS